MLALGALGGGQLSLDLMEAPLDSPVHFDRLFEEARVCLPQFWDDEYPEGELLDDLENYRPLKFVHLCQKFKLRVWNLGKSIIQNGTNLEESQNLWNDLEQLGEVSFLYHEGNITNENAVFLRYPASRQISTSHKRPSRYLDSVPCVSRFLRTKITLQLRYRYSRSPFLG